MSDDIRIQFDREPVFRSGEVVSGVVVVDDYDGSRIEAVAIRAGWMAVGDGYQYDGHHGALVLREGPLVGTGEHRIPFRFEAPLEPMSYRGHLLRIGHLLEARAQVAGGGDLVTERSFELVPGVAVAPAPEPEPEGRLPSDRRKAAGAQAAVGIGLMIAGVATLPLPGVLLLAGGLLFLSAGVRRAFARGRIGEVVMLVHPRVLAPGDELRVAAAVGPPRAVKINGITATLRATEVVARGTSSNRKTERHEVFSKQVELAAPQQLEKNREVLFETLLQIPDQDIWSFRTANGSVEWEVVLDVDVPSWPDWTASSPLIVHPEAQPAIAGARPSGEPQATGASATDSRAPHSRAPGAPATDSRTPHSGATVPAATVPPPGRDGPDSAGIATTPHAPHPAPATAITPGAPRTPATAMTPGTPAPASPAPTAPGAPRRAATAPTPAPHPVANRPPSPAPASGPAATPRPPAPAVRPYQPGRNPPHQAGRKPTRDPGRDRAPFEDALAEVLAAGVVTGNRRALAARMVDAPARCTVVVERVERPFARHLPAPWKDGRVVRARLLHSGHEVEVLMPAASAEDVDALGRGSTLEVDGVVAEWARLPDRPVIRQHPPR